MPAGLNWPLAVGAIKFLCGAFAGPDQSYEAGGRRDSCMKLLSLIMFNVESTTSLMSISLEVSRSTLPIDLC